MLSCSLIFFVTTNFAVWAFSGMYSLDMAGLTQCYVAALPFLKYTVAGDLFWAAVLFGGAWLVQRLTTRATALTTPVLGLRARRTRASRRRKTRRALADDLVRHRARHRLGLGELEADRDHPVVGHRMRHELHRPSGIASLARGGCLMKYAAK